MAKKEKYYIARWVETNPGGGVSMTGFVEFNDEIQRMPSGAQRVRKATVPTSITVKAVPGEDGQEIKYGKEDIFLEQGEFIVQNNPTNVALLKRKCKQGQIQMSDWDLHFEFLGQEAPEQVEVIEREPDYIEYDVTPEGDKGAQRAIELQRAALAGSADAKKSDTELEGAFGNLTEIKCLKIKRTETLQNMYVAGIDSIEVLAQKTIEELRDINGIGPALAEGLLAEADTYMLKA